MLRGERPQGEVTEKQKEKKVKREFPGYKALQDIHYYRYVRDRMANDDALRDCRGYKEGCWRDQKGNEGVHDRMKPPLHITERIWLRAFGPPPKCPFGALRPSAPRCPKFRTSCHQGGYHERQKEFELWRDRLAYLH